MTPALLDCTVRFRGLDDYRYSGTFRVADRVVRVRVCRDDDRGVGFAVAELLTDTLRWAPLLEADAPRGPSQGDGDGVVAGLECFARELASFAHFVPADSEEAR